jgi:ABC-type glycerol-3-phosphate transport system substrate-binding protein
MGKKLTAMILAGLMALSVIPVYAEEPEDLSAAGPEDGAEAPVVLRQGSYGLYMSELGDVDFADDVIVIPANRETAEEGEETFEFTVAKAGLYSIEVTYTNIPGRGSTIERTILINGELPYRELQFVRFPRLWQDTYDFGKFDLDGNSIRPGYAEVKESQTRFVRDSAGYYHVPLAVYLDAGGHTITFVAERENMLIETITLRKPDAVKTYAEVKSEYERNNFQPARSSLKLDEGRLIQAECETAVRTDKANFPVADRTSSATMPQDAYKILINSVTGNKWQNNGSAIYYTFTPDATGLYKITMRCRQYHNRGLVSTRSLTINGKVPFAEAAELRFPYSSDWQVVTLGDDVNGDYEFYFEAGQTYRVGLTVELGEMGDILRRVETSVFILNECYRSILMITGPTPDNDRDYNFHRIIPEVLDVMRVQARELEDISRSIDGLTGRRSANAVQIDMLTHVVNRMVNRPRDIARSFNNLRENLGAVSAWMVEASRQPLDVDWLAFNLEGDNLPRGSGGFFGELAFGFNTFFASFVIDYTRIGSTVSEDMTQNITVWLASGRDQAQIIRQLIDSSFTPEKQISVNLQLVDGGALLPSILAGKGPDVFLGSGLGDPVNFATRNAVQDLTIFHDYHDVAKRFHPSAHVPFTFDNKVFGLPETQSFQMMYYRTDIFNELGLSPPTTWDEFNELIPELQSRNLDIGMPKGVVNAAAGDMNMLLTFMYQNSTELYRDGGRFTNLDSPRAIDAFTTLTNYFNIYKFPVDYEFANRFRSGEMPLGFADYTLYNQFAIFAPEIKGLWEFTSVPGTVHRDANGRETVNYSIPAGGSATIMLRSAGDKDASWEFMKWWTEAKTQADFGVGMESILGESAMYPTANLEALEKLPWQARDYRRIKAQWEYLVGTPEVPGGYMTFRSYAFAFNRLINTYKNQRVNNVWDAVDPGDVMQDYIAPLNAELARKRREFGIE